jgi:hypothetical protein
MNALWKSPTLLSSVRGSCGAAADSMASCSRASILSFISLRRVASGLSAGISVRSSHAPEAYRLKSSPGFTLASIAVRSNPQVSYCGPASMRVAATSHKTFTTVIRSRRFQCALPNPGKATRVPITLRVTVVLDRPKVPNLVFPAPDSCTCCFS